MRSASELSTQAWLVRHGVSTFNALGQYQGNCDESELTKEGRIAARLTGQQLGGAGFGAIICSPLKRARETAREILEGLRGCSSPLPGFEIDDRLKEVDLHEWEGLPFSEVRERFQEQYEAWRFRPHTMRMRSASGESRFPVLDLFERVQRFWNELPSLERGRKVLIVAHAGTGRALINTALGLGPDRFHGIQQSNCGLSMLRFSNETPGRAKLAILNATGHLSDRLPKLKEERTGIRLLLIPDGTGTPGQIRLLARALAGASVQSAIVVEPAGALARKLLNGQSAFEIESVDEAVLRGRLLKTACLIKGPDLSTVVVLAMPEILTRYLRDLLTLEDSAGEFFPLRPLTITAVHCPGGRCSPVLQGMNLFEINGELAGGCI